MLDQLCQEPLLLEHMLQEVQHPSEPVQRAAALALAHLAEVTGADVETVLQRLQDIYIDKLPVKPLSRIILK